MSTTPVDPAEIIFREFDVAADPTWRTGVIEHRFAGKTSESTIDAFDASGNVSYPTIRGFAFDHAVDELRERFAQPRSGAWFSVTIRLTSEGGFSLDADYDHEPEWETPRNSGHYLEEQEKYPRDLDHQPEWYRKKLAEAANR